MRLLAFGLLMLFTAPFSWASDDNIETTINEALAFYQDGKLGDAVNSLQYATQLIQNKKGNELANLLPEPLDGWEAGQAESETSSMAMMGGVMVSRDYRRGNSDVSVQIITDSPMMQAVMMMMANPLMATSQGGQLERVGTHKAVVNFNEGRGDGELTLVIANRFLIQIDANQVSREDLLDYAEAIDTDALASLP